MKKVIIMISIFLMSTFALSFEILGIKSGMTKSEIEASGFKILGSNEFQRVSNLGHPLINKIYLTFDDSDRLYQAQAYTKSNSNKIWQVAALAVLEEKYPNSDIHKSNGDNYFYFNLIDEDLRLSYINRVKNDILNSSTNW